MKRLALVCAAVLLIAAVPVRAAELTVSAAASLTNVFREIAQAFEQANPGTRVVLNFASSGNLLQQIERGAPVDVLASADEETMDRAAAKALIDPASRIDFAANSVVLVVPAGASAIRSVADLAGAAVKRVAVGNPATVPVGRYTRDALGQPQWDALAGKWIPSDNVRQVLAYVQRGEVDAGFVYATDARLAQDAVRVVATLPAPRPIRYPIARVAASAQAALAQRFIDHVRSAPGRSALQRHGFGAPDG